MQVPAATRTRPEPLSVVHFILDHRVGGPHVYVRTLLSAQGTAVHGTLVTSGRGAFTDEALPNLRHVHRFLYPLEVLLNATIIAWRYGVAKRPSLIHVHGAANTAPLVAAALARLPVAWHLHETVGTQRTLARIGSWLVRLTRHVIFTVASEGRVAFGQPAAVLAPGAVDTTFWHRRSNIDNDDADTNDRSLRLVAVGNQNPLKGLDVLLDALGRIDRDKRSLHLTLVGTELSTQRGHAALLRDRANALQTAARGLTVDFAGGLPAEGVRKALERADGFVLPSRSEACPIALLEAMAMSLPCVATDVGDVRAMLPPEQLPLVCAPDDPAALAAALDQLLDMPKAGRLGLGAVNRQTVEACFSPAALARTVLERYGELLRPRCGEIGTPR